MSYNSSVHVMLPTRDIQKYSFIIFIKCTNKLRLQYMVPRMCCHNNLTDTTCSYNIRYITQRERSIPVQDNHVTFINTYLRYSWPLPSPLYAIITQIYKIVRTATVTMATSHSASDRYFTVCT